jgi:predicted lipid-binding transport protein (Tim44 family)
MRPASALAIAITAAGALLIADFADAKRMGGGRSLGAQRSMPQATTPTAPSAAATTPGAASNPVMPAQPGTNVARPGTPAAAAAAPAASGMSRWLAPVAGIAAGLGLAALLSHFGLSETFASMLLIGLLLVGGFLLVRMLLARRAQGPRPLQYAGGAGSEPSLAKGYETQVPPAGKGSSFEPVFGGGSASGAALTTRRYPPGFDPQPFLAQARQQFTRLQTAYDRADRALLADFLTPELFAEIGRELDDRGPHAPTEIVSLNASIEEVVTEGDRHWASVRFTGLTREDGSAQPQPFDEVWNLVKPVKGSSGWLVAGIQQTEQEA